MTSTRPQLLVIDVGNTAASIGLFLLKGRQKSPQPIKVWTLATSVLNTSGPFKEFLLGKMGRTRLSQLQGAIVSSVVPSIDHNLAADVMSLTGHQPQFVSHKSPSPIRVKYKRPSEVGADRLVNARAAWALHPGASIVIDFGTATTFDCVSRKGEYLGGVIAPGMAISAEALFRKTAKLPMVYIHEPADILGKNTMESIRAGLYHGYRGLVKEILNQLTKTLGPRTQVLSTGGQAQWILKGVSQTGHYLPHLTLSGLYHLWLDAH